MSALKATTWHISIRGEDDWPDEHLELTSDEAHSYWFEQGLVIQTNPTGFGDFSTERVIPWSRVIEWLRDSRLGGEAGKEKP